MRFALLVSLSLFALPAFAVLGPPDEPEPVIVNDEPIYSGSYALVIGISDYSASRENLPRGARGWDDLPGVQEDVLAVKEALERSGFEVRLVDNSPGKVRLKEEIEGFFRRYGTDRDNRLLVYYAGHGETVEVDEGGETENRGFIVPSNVPQPEAGVGSAYEAVDMEWINYISGIPSAKHVMFVFDSCFSGTIFRTMRGSSRLPPVISTLAGKDVRQFIASGAANQQVPDVSIFRRQFTAGLAGAADLNRDGYITGTELGFYLRDKVSNESEGEQTPQFAKKPGLRYSEGDLIFDSPIGPSEGTAAVAAAPDEPAAPERPSSPGETFQDCEACPELMVIPSGSFLQGSPEDEKYRADDEPVAAEASVAGTFAIGVYEVSAAEWNTCFSENGCASWRPVPAGGNADLPVRDISWVDAQQYVEWLSKKTGYTYRVPFETEWEYAARAGATTARPWGDDLGEGQANCADCGSESGDLRPRGSFAANRFGLYDVMGNLWEWVANAYDDPGELAWPDGPPKCNEDDPRQHTLKGGSYATTKVSVRSAARAAYPCNASRPNIGLRVMREF